jgi:hypothetical protein
MGVAQDRRLCNTMAYEHNNTKIECATIATKMKNKKPNKKVKIGDATAIIKQRLSNVHVCIYGSTFIA